MHSPFILVTGAAGRIGTAYWKHCAASRRLRLADLDPASLAGAAGETIALDVSDLQACMRACEGVDTVIHLAADAAPDADFFGSLLQTNIVGSYNMMLAAKTQGCRRFVFASSAQAIEGYPLDVQVHEDMPPRPKNMYGVSKAFGEAAAAFFALDGSMSTIAVRIVYGAVPFRRRSCAAW